MRRIEHHREVSTGPLNPEQLRMKVAAGWKLVTLEWQREIEGEGEAADLIMSERQPSSCDQSAP